MSRRWSAIVSERLKVKRRLWQVEDRQRAPERFIAAASRLDTASMAFALNSQARLLLVPRTG
jgi:hypothetical protein